jgi:hypothetical protein
MRNLAERLVARETAAGVPPEAKVEAAFRACEKLRRHISKFAGEAGFRSLLARALVLATAEIPWLSSVEIKADGALGGLGTLPAQQDGDEADRGGVVFLAQLLGLLVLFIGEVLTLRLVGDTWPDAPSGVPNSEREKKP